jgi:hypothetical protein
MLSMEVRHRNDSRRIGILRMMRMPYRTKGPEFARSEGPLRELVARHNHRGKPIHRCLAGHNCTASPPARPARTACTTCA